jgi:hypothetical protein
MIYLRPQKVTSDVQQKELLVTTKQILRRALSSQTAPVTTLNRSQHLNIPVEVVGS